MHDGTGSTAPIRLLHVEDDPAFSDLTAASLDRLDAAVRHEAVRTVREAVERFDEGAFDAVVCDHDLPDGTGIDFLESVREIDPEFPFILFTGKGSEEIASEAISAGVTDYLQKGGGVDQFEMLTNRLRNAVERYRLGRQVERSIAALEAASEPIGILDADGSYLFANDAYASVYGVERETLIGSHWERFYPDDEIERFTDVILPIVTERGYWTGEATVDCVGGGQVRERLVLTHTTDGGHVCIVRGTEPVSES